MLHNPEGQGIAYDIALNLAASLIEKGASHLRDWAFGDAETRALRRAWEAAFETMLTEVAADRDQATLVLLGDIFTDFIRADGVADLLLDLALSDGEPPLTELAARFDALGFDRETLPVDFRAALLNLTRGLSDALTEEAGEPGSPLYNRVSLGRLRELSTILRRIESRVGPTAYVIFAQQVIGSAIGDGAQLLAGLDPETRDLIREAVALFKERSRPAPPYTDADRDAYLDFLISQCAYLDPRRMRSGGGATQQVVIPLEEVYVSLRADPDNPLEREADRRLLELDVEALAKAAHLEELTEEQRQAFRYRILTQEYLLLTQRRQGEDKPVDLADAFRRHRYLVILGDPGAGKTTLTRWLALQFARAMREDKPRVQVQQPGRNEPDDLGPTRLPILLRVADYAQARHDDPDLPLLDYLGYQPIQGEAPPIPPERLHALMRDALARNEAVVLLDGLDEITDPGERLEIVRAIESFIEQHIRTPEGGGLLDAWLPEEETEEGKVALATMRRRWRRGEGPGPAQNGGNQVLLTSRIAGYRAAPLRGDLAHFTIQDMDDEAVDRFCDRWTLAVERFLQRDTDLSDEEIRHRAEREAQALKAAIHGNDGVRRLAANPLLLTILALIHREQTKLPEQRIKLYQQAVQTLVELWRDTGLSEAEVIDVLGPLALYIHENQPTGLATEAEVREVITRALAEWHGYDPARLPGKFKEQVREFLRAVREQSGLLLARGEGLYGFMHLTFQEYFVARQLTRDPWTAIEAITAHLHQPRWREPLLLAVAYLSDTQRGAMERLMKAILEAKAPYEDILHRNLLFAAACIPDTVWMPPRIIRRIVDGLLALYTDAEAGGRFPDLRRAIEEALRPLRRDETAARIVDEALVAALADKDRRFDAARLVKVLAWFTPAVARALLRALPQDAPPAWPLDATLRAIAARDPSSLPDDLLPFRAACRAAPERWEKMKAEPLRSLALALYGVGYLSEPERIYRDSPLTPHLLAALDEAADGEETAALLRAHLPALTSDPALYTAVQVARVALHDAVSAELERDAADAARQPAVREAGLHLLQFSVHIFHHASQFTYCALRTYFPTYFTHPPYFGSLLELGAFGILIGLALRVPRAARAALDALDTHAALDVLDARAVCAIRSSLPHFTFSRVTSHDEYFTLVKRVARAVRFALNTLAARVWDTLWRALGAEEKQEREEALAGLLEENTLLLSPDHLPALEAFLKRSGEEAVARRLLARTRGNDLTGPEAEATLRRWMAEGNPFVARYAALLLAERKGDPTPPYDVAVMDHLIAALTDSDDALRARAGQALERERRASVLGTEVIEELARRTEAADDLRVATRLDWALKAIHHDDPALLRRWVDAAAGVEASQRLAPTGPTAPEIARSILGRIHRITADAFPVLLEGMREGPPVLQEALLNSVSWLLREGEVPEESLPALRETLGHLSTAEGKVAVQAIVCLGHLRAPTAADVETLLHRVEEGTPSACEPLARLLLRYEQVLPFAALRDKEALRRKLYHDLEWRACDALNLLWRTPPFQAAASPGECLDLLGDWTAIPDIEQLAFEAAGPEAEEAEVRQRLKALRTSERLPRLLAALQDAYAHRDLLPRAEESLRRLAARPGPGQEAAQAALCRLALSRVSRWDFTPSSVLDALAEVIPGPAALLRALLDAGTDNDGWSEYHHRVVVTARTLVESRPALLDDLLRELEAALDKGRWPARRILLAVVAAVAERMPAHLLQARPAAELEQLLVRGTTDAGEPNSRRFALTALSHLREVTASVVPAFLAAVQDMHRVQQDAIEAAKHFRRVEADVLPDLLAALRHPSAATAHAVALLLAELGAGRQAQEEVAIRQAIADALAQALRDPASRREVWVDTGDNIKLEGTLEQSFFRALRRVAGA